MKAKMLVAPQNDLAGYGTGVILETVEDKSFVFFPSVGKTACFLSERLIPVEVDNKSIGPFAEAYAKFVGSGKPAQDFCTPHSTTEKREGRTPKKVAPKITVTGGLKGLVSHFIKKTKGGFRSAIFIKQEREYRVRASENFLEHFNRDQFASRLKEGKYCELANELMKMISTKNHGFNSINDQFGDWTRHKESVCGSESDSQKFCEELYGLLYSTDKAIHFDTLVQCFSKNNTPQWPALTAFLALQDYQNYLCVKPGFIRQTCNNIGMEYMGNGGKNWGTYEKFMGFASWLKNEIAKIPDSTLPADSDMLDMQAFIYAVSRDFEY